MQTKPFRQRKLGGGRAYSLLSRQRDLTPDNQAETVERGGYQITVQKNPFWNASTNMGAPFYVVEAYGKSRDEAIENCLARVEGFKEREVA
jgi:hypothetical protein